MIASADLLQAPGHRLEARDVQIALGREVPVEDRLAHTGVARDLGGRRADVAPLAEDLQRGVDDGGAALRRGKPVALLEGGLVTPRGDSASAGSRCRTLRTVRMATTAPRRRCAAATYRPRW